MSALRILRKALNSEPQHDLPSWRRIYALALPAAGSALFNTLFSINDFLWARLLGPNATSALGLVVMVTIFNAGLMALVQKGTLSMVARLRGMEDQAGLRRAALQGVMLALGASLAFGILGVWLSPHLLVLMGGEGEVLRMASLYLRLLYAGFPLMSLAMVMDGIFIGLGDTRTPFRLQLMGVILNAALSAVVLLGLKAGIMGIALATLSTKGLVGASGAILVSRRLSPGAARAVWEGRRAWPRPDLAMWSEILRVGLPVAASITFYSGIFMALNRVLSQFGQEAFSVLGIGIRGNESIGFMVLVGFGAAASTLTGEALGRDARNIRSNLDAHVRATVVRVVVAALPAALFFTTMWLLIPELLCSFYTKDEHLIRLSADYLRIAAVANFFQVMELVLAEGMTGAGVSSLPLMVTVPGNLLRIPLALLLVQHTSWGINAVWAAILISCMVKGTGMVLIFSRTAWPAMAARRTRALGQRIAGPTPLRALGEDQAA